MPTINSWSKVWVCQYYAGKSVTEKYMFYQSQIRMVHKYGFIIFIFNAWPTTKLVLWRLIPLCWMNEEVKHNLYLVQSIPTSKMATTKRFFKWFYGWNIVIIYCLLFCKQFLVQMKKKTDLPSEENHFVWKSTMTLYQSSFWTKNVFW